MYQEASFRGWEYGLTVLFEGLIAECLAPFGGAAHLNLQHHYEVYWWISQWKLLSELCTGVNVIQDRRAGKSTQTLRYLQCHEFKSQTDLNLNPGWAISISFGTSGQIILGHPWLRFCYMPIWPLEINQPISLGSFLFHMPASRIKME